MYFIRGFTLLLLSLSYCAAAAGAAEIDPNSPKGALKALYEAMEAGDAGAVRAQFHASNDVEKDLADAYAAQLTAAKALGDAAKAKYTAAGDALSKGLPLKDEIAKLETAEVTVDGDTATYKPPAAGAAGKPLRLIKSGGRWRLSIADYAGGSADALPGQTAVLRDMTAVFQSTAADILADKFPTPADAQRALQQKLQTVLFNTLQKHPPAATRPTTRPAAR